MIPAIPISDEAAERRNLIRDAWDRYDGQHPASLQAGQGDTNDNVTINHLATIVDTGVDYLWGSSNGEVEFSVQRDGEEDEAASDLLASVWDANHKNTFLQKLGTSGAIAGHFGMKLVPREGKHPRIILLDPLDIVLESNPRDIDERIGYAIDTTVYNQLGTAVGRRREQHTLNDSGQSWTVQWLVTDTPLELQGLQHTVQWTPDPQRPEPEVWPYAFPAIVDGQNMPNPHREWGKPDLSLDILATQEAINRVASNEAKTLRHFAHPQPVAVGENPKTMQSFIDASIGSVMCLPTGSSYGYTQMQGEGLAASREYRGQLADALFEIARVPRIAAGKVEKVQAQTGVALLMLYRPLVAKTQGKRDTYGDALKTLCERILALSGMNTDGIEIIIGWPDVMPRNLAEEAQTAEVLLRLGVSKQTLLEKMGFNADQEAQRTDEEAMNPLSDTHGLLTRIEDNAADASDATVSVSE